jgi:hypothetical protein
VPTVVSSYLAALEWKEGSGLIAQFTNGRVAQYPDVAESVYTEVIGSASVGSAFDRLVKKGGYAFTYLV